MIRWFVYNSSKITSYSK